ncbi:hypothetical protein PP7435_CHR1-0271 [Komagataella phaffii CBS 7435]|uniref:RWD domain-containing protein n=1 Tax=Komagataella phaffii (strain ATCC 76273 / CBS 7435 / CECT 11047 / NRRL Y-11430 / Wegner 21-1) TaxID=981350 RepID=F2QNJ9_KOMPC|nr:Hypothetical protein BQ9382_C1-1405 [Komagataella phaffii CBS 7435]CCA36432.1 hypothetical protein PP7435_CHR1-0271 [Komagataella phaffii CBS 7435]
MDYKEEQTQEIEILESIYPDELERISDTEFTISLLLETASERKHRLSLHVTYPETYPEVTPDLKVSVDDSFDAEEGGESDDEESSSEEQVKLEFRLIDEAYDNIGIPSIFSLTSTLKDAAETLFQEKLNKATKEHEEELLKIEREEQKKFRGTPVTVESFNAWRLRFRKELGLDEKQKKRLEKLHNGKLTGKEIFERGLAGGDDVDEVTESVAQLTTEDS